MNSHWNEIRYWTDGAYRKTCQHEDIKFKFDTTAAALETAPDNDVIELADDLFTIAAKRENIQLMTNTVISDAVFHVLSAGMQQGRHEDVKNDLAIMTDNFLNDKLVHRKCRYGTVNLSQAAEIWVPSLAPDALMPVEKQLLYTLCDIGHDFSQQVTDIAAQQSEAFRHADQAADITRQGMLNHAATLFQYMAQLGPRKPSEMASLAA